MQGTKIRYPLQAFHITEEALGTGEVTSAKANPLPNSNAPAISFSPAVSLQPWDITQSM